MLSISLVLLALSVSPETGLYVSGQAQETTLEKAVLLEELQARLPGLNVMSVPTQDQGRFYTLEFSEQAADKAQTMLLFILKDAENNILLKRSLEPSAQSLATARQIALVIEGIIKRRGDALNEILMAQKPEPKPEPVVLTEIPTDNGPSALQLDTAMTFGALLGAKRSTVGLQVTAQHAIWQSLYLGLQGGFQHLLADGNRDTNAQIGLFEWTAVGVAKWQYDNDNIGFSVLTGAGIAISQSKAKYDDTTLSYGRTDTLLLIRTSIGLSWEISNDFSMIASFSADFTPSYPDYQLQSQGLLSRGSTSIFASLGCRYSPF